MLRFTVEDGVFEARATSPNSGTFELNDEVADAIRAIFPRSGQGRLRYAKYLARLFEIQDAVQNPYYDPVCATAICKSTASLMGRPCRGDDDEEHYRTADELVGEALLYVAHRYRAAADLDPT